MLARLWTSESIIHNSRIFQFGTLVAHFREYGYSILPMQQFTVSDNHQQMLELILPGWFKQLKENVSNTLDFRISCCASFKKKNVRNTLDFRISCCAFSELKTLINQCHISQNMVTHLITILKHTDLVAFQYLMISGKCLNWYEFLQIYSYLFDPQEQCVTSTANVSSAQMISSEICQNKGEHKN